MVKMVPEGTAVPSFVAGIRCVYVAGMALNGQHA